MKRIGSTNRDTLETRIRVEANIDGTGSASLSTGLPRLSVDRGYLIAATFLATLAVFAVSEVHPRSKTTIKEFGKDKNKTIEGAGILTCAFVIGGILSYIVIDKSIYDSLKETNMNNAI